MVNESYRHSKLTGEIIGCAMEVHSQMGNGFQEVVYQRALAIEMGLRGIPFSREHEMGITYKGSMVGTRRVDFFVANMVMVELKAVAHLEDVHLAYAINYLEAYQLEIGLLINFGTTSLQFKRLQNKKLVPAPARTSARSPPFSNINRHEHTDTGHPIMPIRKITQIPVKTIEELPA